MPLPKLSSDLRYVTISRSRTQPCLSCADRFKGEIMRLLHLLSATALTSVAIAVPGTAWASAAPAPAAPQDQNATSCPPGTTNADCNNQNPDDNC